MENQNPSAPTTAMERFIWRRAFRSADRRVSRSDVMTAIGVSQATASRALAQTAASSAGLLVRKEKWLEAPPWAVLPPFVGEDDLKASLLAGRDGFADLGLTQDELPIQRSTWSNEMPRKSGVLDRLVQGLAKRQSIYVQAVDFEEPGKAEWMRVLPLSIEQHGPQFHLLVQDVEASTLSTPVTRLVPFRGILDAKDDPKLLSRRFTRAGHRDSTVHLAVTAHRAFESDQKSAIERVFSIQQGKVDLPSRSVPFFLEEQRLVERDGPDLLEIPL